MSEDQGGVEIRLAYELDMILLRVCVIARVTVVMIAEVRTSLLIESGEAA